MQFVVILSPDPRVLWNEWGHLCEHFYTEINEVILTQTLTESGFIERQQSVCGRNRLSQIVTARQMMFLVWQVAYCLSCKEHKNSNSWSRSQISWN